MNNPFDILIDSFLADKIGLDNNFLTALMASNLKTNLLELIDSNKMAYAGTGNADVIARDKKVRGDKIYWLDRKHHNQYEDDFLNLMDSFVVYLNTTCYTGITGYEFHYALYESGSFYKKHLDRFKNNDGRRFSMIIYLNENWETKDGGELSIHQDDIIQNISPDNRKGVFFRSNELEHEVLLTNKTRMSITGWLTTKS